MSEQELWAKIHSLEQQLNAMRTGVLQDKGTPDRTIRAKYTSAAGQSIPDSAVTVVNFDTKVYDTHNAVTTGAAFKFTAPVTRLYCWNSVACYNESTAWTEGERQYLAIRKNGVIDLTPYRNMSQASGGTAIGDSMSGGGDVYLLTGEYVDIVVFQNTGGALALKADATLVCFMIHSVRD